MAGSQLLLILQLLLWSSVGTIDCLVNGVFFPINVELKSPFTESTIKTTQGDVKLNTCGNPDSKSCCEQSQLDLLWICQNSMVTTLKTELVNTMKSLQGTITAANQEIIKKLAASSVTAKRRRRLQSDSYDPKVYINQFLSKYEFSERLASNLEAASQKCWNYYVDKIMAGMLCSLCNPSDNTKYGVSSAAFQQAVTTQSCDLLIAQCFQTIEMHTKLTEFMRNVIYLMLQKTGQGSATLSNFLKLYPKQDPSDYVESCRASASCDNLCVQLFKIGSFDNPFIFGNSRIYTSFNRFATGENEKGTKGEPFDTTSGIKEDVLYRLKVLQVITDTDMTATEVETWYKERYMESKEFAISTCIKPFTVDTTSQDIKNKMLKAFDRNKKCGVGDMIHPNGKILAATHLACFNMWNAQIKATGYTPATTAAVNNFTKLGLGAALVSVSLSLLSAAILFL